MKKHVETRPALLINADNDPQRESSILSMKFKVRKHHVRNGRIDIRCEAAILQSYKRSRDEEIFVRTTNSALKNTSNQQFHSKAANSEALGLLKTNLITILALLGTLA